MANILSLGLLSDYFWVFMDYSINNAFYIFDERDKHIWFYQCPIKKLYCLDVSVSTNGNFLMSAVTINRQEQHFSALDCTCAKSLRKLQHIMACPSNYDLAHAIEHNMIGNNAYTQCDVKNSRTIFGPSVPGLKGKTVKMKSKLPREDEPIEVPSTIVRKYKDIMLSIDVMQVNKTPFLVSKAHHLGYYQCIQIQHKTKAKFMEGITKMCNKYRERGIFRVTQIEGDNVFEWIRSDLEGDPFQIRLNTCDAEKYVPKTERSIRKLKERIRCARMIMQSSGYPGDLPLN